MIGGTSGGVPGVETNVEDYQMLDDTTSRYDRVSRIINNELNEINKRKLVRHQVKLKALLLQF